MIGLAFLSDYDGCQNFSDLKLSDLRQWSIDQLEDEAKIGEAVNTSNNDPVRFWAQKLQIL